MKGFLGCALLLAACSSSAGDASDDDAIACEPGECSGTYLASFTQIGGDCAPLEPQVTRLDSLADFAGCSERSPTIFSGDMCQVEADLVCPRTDGSSVVIVGTLKQADDACHQVIATATFALYDSAESLLCSGTYRILYDRQ